MRQHFRKWSRVVTFGEKPAPWRDGFYSPPSPAKQQGPATVLRQAREQRPSGSLPSQPCDCQLLFRLGPWCRGRWPWPERSAFQHKQELPRDRYRVTIIVSVLIWRHAVRDLEMPLQRFLLLPAFKADEVIGRDRGSDRTTGFFSCGSSA